MFQQLVTLLQTCTSISINLVAAQNGQITVTVIPKPKLTENAEALSTPLRLTGSPQELDEQFVDLFGKYASSHTSLAEQIETTTSILDAAKTDSQKKATKALTAPKDKTETKSSKSTVENADDLDEEEEESGGGSSSKEETPASHDKTTSSVQGDSAAAASETESLWG